MFSPEAALVAMTDVVANCEVLEAELVRRRHVVQAAVDAQRPGGAENPDESALGWLTFNRWLHRTHATAGRASAPSTENDDALERTLAAALTDKPCPVECSDGETRFVYPKSYDTLRFLDQLDVELRVITAEWAVARESASSADAAIESLAPRMEATVVRLWAWILADSRAELPFAENEPLPELPDWTRRLTPEDLVSILRAHLEVNARRTQVIASAFPPDPDDRGGSRLTLAGFLGSIAAEHAPGMGKHLLKSIPLAQVFATHVAAAKAQRDAMAKAKEKRD